MRALFVGLGSIGTRHLKNLTALCKEKNIPLEAYALRSSARELPAETAALLAGQFTELPQGEKWDLAFITNPTIPRPFAGPAGRPSGELFHRKAHL